MLRGVSFGVAAGQHLRADGRERGGQVDADQDPVRGLRPGRRRDQRRRPGGQLPGPDRRAPARRGHRAPEPERRRGAGHDRRGEPGAGPARRARRAGRVQPPAHRAAGPGGGRPAGHAAEPAGAAVAGAPARGVRAAAAGAGQGAGPPARDPDPGRADLGAVRRGDRPAVRPGLLAGPGRHDGAVREPQAGRVRPALPARGGAAGRRDARASSSGTATRRFDWPRVLTALFDRSPAEMRRTGCPAAGPCWQLRGRAGVPRRRAVRPGPARRPGHRAARAARQRQDRAAGVGVRRAGGCRRASGSWTAHPSRRRHPARRRRPGRVPARRVPARAGDHPRVAGVGADDAAVPAAVQPRDADARAGRAPGGRRDDVRHRRRGPRARPARSRPVRRQPAEGHDRPMAARLAPGAAAGRAVPRGGHQRPARHRRHRARADRHGGGAGGHLGPGRGARGG